VFSGWEGIPPGCLDPTTRSTAVPAVQPSAGWDRPHPSPTEGFPCPAGDVLPGEGPGRLAPTTQPGRDARVTASPRTGVARLVWHPSDPDAFNTSAGHSVMAMITSAANPPWPLDCSIADLRAAGLPAPSKVRFKLFTLDHRLIRGRLGRLSADDEVRVRQGLTRLLGLSAEGRPSPKGRGKRGQ
jgi:mRNA interferase MazF